MKETQEFKRYPKIFGWDKDEVKDIFLDDEDVIVIEEKIDGANFRFMVKDGKLVFGSRRTVLDEDASNRKNYERMIEYIKSKFDFDLWEMEGYIFYGEAMIKHTIMYDYDKLPPFIGFDIYTPKGWLTHKTKEIMFTSLGIHTVPILQITKAKLIKEVLQNELLKKKKNILDDLVPQSKLYKGKAEGLVFKNYSKNIWMKYVTTIFKKQNKDTFGKQKAECKNDNELFVVKYANNYRIDNVIFSLLNEGHKLEMQLMKYLPTRLLHDILEEDAKEIFRQNWVLDLHKIRKMITKRCQIVLKDIILRNNLGE